MDTPFVLSTSRTFESFAAAAVEWSETSIRLLAEKDGTFFYEVLEHASLSVDDMCKAERYGIGCWDLVSKPPQWNAWDCTDRVFGGEGSCARCVSPEALELFRRLYELLP